MEIICGADKILLEDIESVHIRRPGILSPDLETLEEQYHGSLPKAEFGVISRSLSRPLDKFDLDIINKYQNEISWALICLGPSGTGEDKWPFDIRTKCHFSFPQRYFFLEEQGDVQWEYASGKEVPLYFIKHLLPALHEVINFVPPKKTKGEKAGEVVLFLLSVALLRNDLLPDNFTVSDKAKEELTPIYEKLAKYKSDTEKVEQRYAVRKEFLEKYRDKKILRIELRGTEDKIYLEDYCGFDIFSKKLEIEEGFALRKAQRIAQINEKKTSPIAVITADFYERNLLSTSSLTNSEKLAEYSAVQEFCSKYIPALTERGFKIESIYEDYPDYISEDAIYAFKENWVRLSRSFSALSRGASGEEKVYEVLSLFDDRIRILREYVWDHEHDFIIISPYGISTIEVKNLHGDYLLTETGILKCLSSEKVKPKDVALQSKKHLETLRRNLSGCPAFSPNVPLQEIICSAEANFTIKDEYHYIPVCYYNTVDKILLPEGGKEILSTKAMDEIQRYLLENKRETFKFDVFLPRGEIDSREAFIKNFAEVASGYLVANWEIME